MSTSEREVDNREVFKTFLQRNSWPRPQNYERVVHDRWLSAHYDEALREPRRQVLLLSEDGRVVLGYHNENNDEVWALSGRGKDGGFDKYRDSWSLADIIVGEIPGCIEYLETLLEEDGTCGHSPLIGSGAPGEYSAIPARLCFFSQWSDPDRGVNDDIFFVDTKNLCEDCYRKAVPRGFNVWSTTYFDKYNQQVDQDFKSYFQKCLTSNQAPNTYDPDSGSFLRLHWPRCYSIEIGELAFKEESYPRMPGATVAHECWRWLVWNRAPFYIDQLCVYPPYTVYDDPHQKQQENQRISKLNSAAYIGAAHGILGVPPGGRGEWTMVELRILGKRALRLPDDFGDAAALVHCGPGYIVHGDTYWTPPPVKFSGRLKKDPGYGQIAMPQIVADQKSAPSERLPEEQKVLDELLVQIGRSIGPTAEEIERIRQFPNRDYSETVRKYEELLSQLEERMRLRETTAPVDKTPHPTVLERAENPQSPTKILDSYVAQDLMASLQLSDDNLTPRDTQKILSPSPTPEKPTFYRRFAGKHRPPQERDVDDVRGSGRLNRLYCHDASPYVYRGTFRLVEDKMEVEKWLLGLRNRVQEGS
ncbi:hypothetical protein CONLIGDRAFT_645214 [Coniochaeta ligniaria NRRL 30616]|uniref:Uncharacterized protein n=1 Tax=Coniochaeta ligniaria NRRL 30616 TaxID=1408157 RepID=A0A1J7IPF6_9PEZI|nr:hypothetical protein CONLIGDRAFT_645214 [Coniochaeta ligniaria NRRL 30616]